MKARTWDDILADRSLRDLPYKIGTNRYHQLTEPASTSHGNLEHEIGVLLRQNLPGGKVINEAPPRTSEEVRVAYVAWISRERWEPVERATALPVAPELSVEILPPSNCCQVILEKMTLYYAQGAQEVWLCDEASRLEFFTDASAPAPVPASLLCPDFPQQINVD